MRVLSLTSVLLVLAVIGLGQDGKTGNKALPSPHGQSAQSQSKGKKQPGPETPFPNKTEAIVSPVLTPPDQPYSRPEQRDAEQKSPDRKDRLIAIVIAFATVIYALMSILTYFTLRQQASIMRDTMSLTRESVTLAQQDIALTREGMGRLERPWVFVQPEPSRSIVLSHQQMEIQVFANLQVTNDGRSPCWITRAIGVIQLIDGSQNLQGQLDYDSAKSIPLGNINLPPQGGREFTISGVIDKAKWNIATSDPKRGTILAYGRIEYRDVFDTTHETYFCFTYDPKYPSALRPCDPGPYTQQT